MSEHTNTINAAVDRCVEQLEASDDPDTTSAWAEVLAGLEVTIDLDGRINELETVTSGHAARLDRLDEARP